MSLSLPSIVSDLPGLKAHDTTATPSTTNPTSSSSSQTSLNSLGTTFMKLLVQELQNQDPTAPMDSTQMVGQMISLNQLDQVASINQLLTNTLGSGSSTTSGNTPAVPTTPSVSLPGSHANTSAL